MNRERFSFFLFIALLISAIYYSKTLQTPFINLSHSIKSFYHQSTQDLSELIDMHFGQAQKIAIQSKEIEELKKNHLLSHQFASELTALFQQYNTSLSIEPEIALARSLSYANFGDISKVWLDFPEFNRSKIYGLSHNELAAGIVVARQGKPLALLNIDRKSAYAVFVGSSKAPGIAHGNGIKELIIEYIPTYKEINVGDEVLTSGLDQLFFPGLKVGKVVAINKAQGYQNAVVLPYYDATNPEFFHVIKSVR
ncbi:MAG: rod shape-determining protein MreC [Campylobacterota bacterium]|nr:rod shape-determining protein MreC [Campylobacterota bacterium]